MISAFFKALGDLGSPRFRSVLWTCFFLSLATAIVLWGGLSWLIFSTELVGVLPWIGGALETFIDIFGSVAAFLLMILMPLTFSIANGLALGIVAYPIVKRLGGRGKDVHPLIDVLAVLFIARYLFMD